MQKAVSIFVAAPLTITTTSLSHGVVTWAYTECITTGGAWINPRSFAQEGAQGLGGVLPARGRDDR